MSKIKDVFIFVVNENGEEKIVTWPNEHGIAVPLVYIDKKDIVEDNMKKSIQGLADRYKLYFELRTYQLVEIDVEKFYPTTKEYNA